MLKLNDNEYGVFYKTYLDVLTQYSGSVTDILEISYNEAIKVFNDIPIEKHMYAYEEGKWTIKELLQHLIDTERIFAYRALRFARKDATQLPGFEENDYVSNCNANHRNFSELLVEFELVRKSTLVLFNSFTEQAMLQMGNASNTPISVRAIGYIISGHLFHHLNIMKERYLK